MTDRRDVRVIGTSEAAAILGWHQRKVQRAAITGSIPIIRSQVGDRKEYLFDAIVIEDLAASQTP